MSEEKDLENNGDSSHPKSEEKKLERHVDSSHGISDDKEIDVEKNLDSSNGLNEEKELEKGGDLGQQGAATQPDTDAIHPSTDFSEQNLSENDPEHARPRTEKEVEPPPDGGYGWVCVMCVFLVNAHTWGLNSSYGIFLAHYLASNTFPGASDLDFAFVGGLSISMAQAISPFSTFTTRNYGTRTTLVLGILFQTAALLGASWSTQIWQLFLSQGVCFGFGMGLQFNATVGVIPQWFSRRRSFANSIGTAGSGIGGLIYSLAANAIIQRWGTGWAFRILAIASAAASGFSALLLRDRNKAIGAIQVAFHISLLKRTEYLLTLLWGCFSIMGYVGLLFSLPSYANTVGLTASQGSILGAMLNLGQGLGRPVIGYVSDSFGRMNTALLGTFLAGLFSLVIWIFAKGFGVLIFFALIAGGVAGTFWTTVAPVTAEVVGLRMLPSALSIMWPSLIIPSTFAEPIALWLRTDNGSNFLHAQIFTGFMYIGATLCLWLVRAWKISELEKANANSDPLKREAEIRDDDAVPREPVVTRTVSKAVSVTEKAKAARNLWALVKV